MTGRTFTASLKPAWTDEQINAFLDTMRGTAICHIITHDKDANEDTGEAVEPHTHILIDYDTPRKISTVANLLKVDENFIEIVRNKRGAFRYLTHIDDDDKYQYSPTQVYTNYSISYEEQILGTSLNDRDIAKMLANGQGLELLGVVPSTKLRTIQAFLQYDRSGQLNEQLSIIKTKLDSITDTMDKVEQMAVAFANGLNNTIKQLQDGFLAIAKEIRYARLRVNK